MSDTLTATTAQPHWTTPYLGVQHYPNGQYRTDSYRASVENYGKFAELVCWHPGCGFSPARYTFQDVITARAAGEAYVRSNGRIVPAATSH